MLTRKIIPVPVLIILFIISLSSTVLYSQTPTYSCTLANDTLKSLNVYEFDIFILNTGTAPMQLGGIQMGLTYNNAVKNGGTITASWVTGSADTEFITSGQAYSNVNTATAGLVKISAKLPANGPGTGANISGMGSGNRIGRMRLTNSAPFLKQNLNISWNYSSVLGSYPTKLSVYLPAETGGINTDITDTAMFINKLANPVLPVELTSFSASTTGREVNLIWETKTEVNTREFEIERTDLNANGSASAWTTAGVMKAAGTSLSALNYSFSDKNLQAGKYQYRLKIIDIDGSFKYSKVSGVEIALPKEFSINQNYPNPFNPSTKIDYEIPVDAKVLLDVYNITGQKVVDLVNQDQQAGYYSVNFSSLSAKLASGIYIYRFMATEKGTGNNFTSMLKMVLLK